MYKTLFFNLFKLWLKKSDEQSMAHLNAVLTISLFLAFNLMTVFFFGSMFLNEYNIISFRVPELTFEGKVYLVLFFIILNFVHYLALARKNKLNEIKEKNISKSKKTRKKEMLFTVAYLILTILLPILTGVIIEHI